MRFRKLRIVWSVGWGVVGVLLCVLWVRSYWQVDHYKGTVFGWFVEGGSSWGQFWTAAYHSGFEPPWTLNSFAIEEPDVPPGFGFSRSSGAAALFLPYWVLVLVMAMFAGTAWLPFRRFSLRTLLIATTVAAVGLATIVALSR